MRAWSAFALTLALLSACGDSGGPRPPLPGRPAVIDVKMKEFEFVHAAPSTPGRVVFRVRNIGKLLHQVTVIPLAEDVPPIREQLQGSERRSVTPFAGMPPQRPDELASFAVDLAPGARYALICFVRDESGSHAQKGMASEFRAGGAGAKRPPSTTTTTTTTAVAPTPAPASPGAG